MKTMTNKTFELVQKALEASHYEAICMEPRLKGAFANSARAVKESCKTALDALKEPQIEVNGVPAGSIITNLNSLRADATPEELATIQPPPGGVEKGELMTVEDQTFALHDGHYCTVAGRIFGPWMDRGAAAAGMQTEQRRLAKRRE